MLKSSIRQPGLYIGFIYIGKLLIKDVNGVYMPLFFPPGYLESRSRSISSMADVCIWVIFSRL